VIEASFVRGKENVTISGRENEETNMIRLDHLAIPVHEVTRSRDWYTLNLDLKVEFEVPQRKTVALKDDGDMTLFLYEPPTNNVTPSCTLTFQVDDVDAKYRELLGRGVEFQKSPQKLMWGYGAELRDPDGYLVYLWDEKSMREKGSG
jgi:catechol 2,3-dioxygenase-like lactoylglutathione lyase family enzyme